MSDLVATTTTGIAGRHHQAVVFDRDRGVRIAACRHVHRNPIQARRCADAMKRRELARRAAEGWAVRP